MFLAKSTTFDIPQSLQKRENYLRTSRYFLSRHCVKFSTHIVILITSMALSSCSTKSDTQQFSDSNKLKQYYIKGEQLYLHHCSNCHQKNGTGLGLVYPPLHISDYMTNQLPEVICLIKNGKAGELVVNGKSYNQRMPGIPTLSDLEIAEIATYIYNTWGHSRGLVDVQEVSKILRACE